MRTSSTQAEKEAEQVRRQRIQRDAARPMGVNLAATIALSHALASIAGAARKR